MGRPHLPASLLALNGPTCALSDQRDEARRLAPPAGWLALSVGLWLRAPCCGAALTTRGAGSRMPCTRLLLAVLGICVCVLSVLPAPRPLPALGMPCGRCALLTALAVAKRRACNAASQGPQYLVPLYKVLDARRSRR